LALVSKNYILAIFRKNNTKIIKVWRMFELRSKINPYEGFWEMDHLLDDVENKPNNPA